MKKIIIQITSGHGPAECHWVVAQILKYFTKEASGVGINNTIIHREVGDQNGTVKTASVSLEGHDIEAFLENWIGTIQWIGQSKFRKLHKRRNWFVGVNRLDSVGDQNEILDRDIRYEFTRSGGPGGQHVNKVSTAARAIHVPSGETIFVSQGRSQLQNKQEAKRRLLKRLEEKHLLKVKENIKEEWENHDQLERGNPVRVFRGSDFKPDHQIRKYKSNRKSSKQKMLKELDD